MSKSFAYVARIIALLSLLAACKGAPSTDHKYGAGGFVQSPLGGDLTGSASNATVTGLEGVPFAGTPDAGLVPTVSTAGTITWAAPGSGTFTAAGDLTGTSSSQTVARVNGATIPASGALTTGNAPYVSGAAALTYSALNLAGGSGWVTGTLPAGNQASQSMAGDVTGSTAASVVARVDGITYPSATLTAGQVPRATGASTVAYGAVDLTNASAVTGTLPAGNLPNASTGALGIVELAGNLGGTAASPTVVGLTFGSDAQGDIAYRDASAWKRLAAGTSGQALITGGASANPAWGANFGANNVVTTGALSVGTNPSVTGSVRIPNNSVMSARNAANSGDLSFYNTDTSNVQYFGTTNNAGTAIVSSSTGIFLRVNSAVTNYLSVTTASLLMGSPLLQFSSTMTAPSVNQATVSTNSATGQALLIQAQSASGTTSIGGDLQLSPGTGTSSNGNLVIQNVSTSATASAGALTPPALCSAYLPMKVGSTSYKICLYLP